MTDLLRDAMNACFFHSPLEANDPRRVDLHALGVRGRDYDPIARFKTVIQTSDKPTQQLFSGFVGSGKSTELTRLAANLQCDGYATVLIDCEDYLDLYAPPRVSDLLAVTAAGVDRFIQDNCRSAVGGAFLSYWERFRNFLGAEVTVEGTTLKVPMAGELAFKLKQDVGFKTKLYQHLERNGRLADLAQECHRFLDEAVAVVSSAFPKGQGLVAIVDSFEKVRSDDYRRAEEVRLAVESVFIRDWKWLRLPFHVVYTVPSWLIFFEFGAAIDVGPISILPMCRLMDGVSGEPVPEGFAAMRQILAKRMRLEEVLEDTGPLDDLIEASGGYPRDFLRMMREALLRAIMGKATPPIPPEDLRRFIHQAIAAQAAIYDRPIYDEDVPLLAEVARTHDVPRARREQAFRMAELFDSHFVLGYRNGREWYDLHPLVRRSPKLKAALREADGESPEA